MANAINKSDSISLAFCALMLLSQQPSYAGFGNLFGGDSQPTAQAGSTDPTPPGAPGAGLQEPDNPPKALFGNKKKDDEPGPLNANGDFTEDEKRMQHKWNDRLANAHHLIDRGEKMMKSCGSNHNAKDYKKGKVLKEIGERDLVELKTNSPFPSTTSLEDKKKTKPDSL